MSLSQRAHEFRLFRSLFGSVFLSRPSWPRESDGFPLELYWGYAEEAEKASGGETVVQKGVSGESVSSLPIKVFSRFKSKP